MGSKYAAHKTEIDGKIFDSKKEARRYQVLKELEREGKISGLKCQEVFELIPSQRIDGKVVERAVTYRADFTYQEDGNLVVEDVKGFRTDVYKIKKKLMLYIHGIRIKET